ncbi:MAG: helix-turn-helix transcriptional regulator, partial [Actinobacteria bacterium]|nr:helix-turn-helix transcriptional regulator [Actinomycetota bacterium]
MSDTESLVTTEGIRARKHLGMLIKEARCQYEGDGRALTQGALGKLMDCTQSKIQKIEAGSVRVTPGTVEQLIDLLHVSEADAHRMRTLVEASAASEPWAAERRLVPPYARKYMEQEQIATEILSWHELRIPGPVQSEQYMLRQFQTEGTTDVAPLLRNRKRRKRIFHQPHLQRYECILAEEALHRAASGLGRDIARDQIDHLLAINDLNNPTIADNRTSIRLLPDDADIAYLPGDLSLLHFAKRDSLAYFEHAAGADYVRDVKAIKKVQTAWQS